MRRIRSLCPGVVALGATLVCAPALGDEPPRSLRDRVSSYEAATIALAEAALGGTVEPAPERQLVEAVEIFRLDPVDARDPAPAWLNAVHTTTREALIRRELVLGVGARYRQVLADESARNVRRLPQVSLVLVLAFRGTEPGRVRLVVITKDTWSLIPNLDLPVDARTATQSLALDLDEQNVAGTHTTLGAHLELAPRTRTYGAHYSVPRLAGTFLTLRTGANAIQNRDSGKLEGSRGGLQVILPFRTDRSPWSAFGSAIWDRHHVRTPTDEWTAHGGSAAAELTRSFGWGTKNDLSLVFLGTRSAYEAQGARSPAMPPSNSRLAAGLEWHGYTSDFLRTHELETFGLAEDFRLGHELVVRAMPLLEMVPWRAQADFPAGGDPERPTRHELVSVYAAVQETLALGDGLVRASVAAQRDYGAHEARDSSLFVHVDLTSPRTGFGRLVADARAWYRRENWLNEYQWLGGNTGLRGYRDGFVHGDDTLLGHLEYRTPGLRLASEHLGAVAFADTGAVYDSALRPEVLSDLGIGLRLVTPALDRAGLRLDVGFPVGPHRHADPFNVELAFGQAFDVGSVARFGPPRL